jgi:flagellar hook-associated protein 3 FlgL
MRVTERQIFDRAARSGEAARSGLATATGELSSGRRVQRAYDDPAATSRILRLQAQSSRADGISAAAAAARNELDVVDGTLGEVANVMTRAKELAVTFANDSYDAPSRQAAALEVAALSKTLVTLANQRLGDRYLFAGDLTDKPPFLDDGTYVGDDGVRRIEIGFGVEEDVSFPGDELFKGAGGGADLFASLASLQAALEANDADAIRGSIGGLDSSIAQAAAGRAEVGSVTPVIMAAESAADMVSLKTQIQAAELGEVDVIDAASRLQASQTALEASLQATKSSFSMTLLDKIG